MLSSPARCRAVCNTGLASFCRGNIKNNRDLSGLHYWLLVLFCKVALGIIVTHKTRQLTGRTEATATGTIVACIPSVCHCDFVLLKDVSTPHAFSIDTGVGSSAKGATKTGFFSLRPPIGPHLLEIALFSWAPSSRRFKNGWISNCRWTCISTVEPYEVGCIEKPLWILSHKSIRQAI